MAVYSIDGESTNTVFGYDGVQLVEAFDIDGNQVLDVGPQTLKVMSYNVGSWTWFGINATSSNQEKYYALQNAIFTEEDVDLAGLQEYYSQIGTYSVPTMLAQYSPYVYAVDKTSRKAGRAICSTFAMANAQEVNFQHQNGEIRSYLIGDVTINGKTVKFLNAHLALDNATIILQIQELLAAVANLDYWILTGDFNIPFPDAQSDGYTYLVKPFLDAGYHVANGSAFGFIPTFSYYAAGDDRDWRVLDNIMCSANIEIVNVHVNEQKLDTPTGDPIDHLPLIADVIIT